MSVLFHPCNANVVADTLSIMTMGYVFHVEEDKKDLVKYDHRLASLGARLEDSRNCYLIVHHNYESYLVAEVNSKQHIDPSQKDLKETFLGKHN